MELPMITGIPPFINILLEFHQRKGTYKKKRFSLLTLIIIEYAKPFHGLRFRNRETKPQKNCVCAISVFRLKLVLNHSAITKFVFLNAEIEYFFIGYLLIAIMRATIFSYLSAIFKQFNYLLNLFCNIYD